MGKTISIYVQDENLLAEIDAIRWRERKSLSEIINLAIAEYVKHHKDGNEQYTLDNPIVAAPAFFREFAVWEKYYKNLNDSEEPDHRFKLHEICFLHRRRFGGMSF